MSDQRAFAFKTEEQNKEKIFRRRRPRLYNGRVKDDQQLSLTEAMTGVPRFYRLAVLVMVLEAVGRGLSQKAQIAEELALDEATTSDVLELARWLNFLTLTDDEISLTQNGRTFVDSVPARGRLFSHAIFQRNLIQRVQFLKRQAVENEVDPPDNLVACKLALEALTTLTPLEIQKRAEILAELLDAAYKPSRIDWKTGDTLAAYQNITFEFEGRTFLTTLAARQFSSEREIRIGFPYQVRRFVDDRGLGLSERLWGRASLESADRKATWFGSVPVHRSTVSVANRGGRDLRRLLVTCVPFVTLAVSILSARPSPRSSFRLTSDMYGVRVLDGDRDLGSLFETLELLAQNLHLTVVRGLPKLLSHAPPDVVRFGTGEDLLHIMVDTQMIVSRGSTFELSPAFVAELREAAQDSVSMYERLKPAIEAAAQL